MRRMLLAMLALSLIAGCTRLTIFDFLFGTTTVPTVPTETGSSKLLPFASEQELVDFISRQITARNERSAEPSPFLMFDGAFVGFPSAGGADLAAAPTATSAETADLAANNNFSQTTIQEEGVDEADVVKTDGTYLYIMDEGVLKIVSIADPNQMQWVGSTAIEGFGRDMFLHGDTVVVLTSSGGGFFPLPFVDTLIAIEPGFVGDFSFEPPSTTVTIVDVSSRVTPTILSTTKFEGSHSASRMIDGVLHFVVSIFEDSFIDVITPLGTPVSDLDATAVLPSFERIEDGEVTDEGEAVTWDEVFRPTDPDGYGIVTLISLDVDNDASFTGVGVVAQPGLIYSSLESMYLTDTEFGFGFEPRQSTDIYKFDYVDRGAVPSGTGSVPGRILNQYSMSEHNGFLRVATTLRGTFDPFGPSEGPTNNVYVLASTDDGLTVTGRIEKIAPGETIQSARFVGDRGYLVTFEQVDPFFTLDLADPTQPRVVGELKIPGFSTFIVPMDADHLLAVGEYIPEGDFFGRGVQLSIFDVTDFANPQQTANVVLGEASFAYSEALGNPKAFTYFAERDLVALPISIEEQGPFVDVIFVDPDEPVTGDEGDVPDETVLIAPVPPDRFDGLVVYRVLADTGFTELGRISTAPDGADFFFGPSFTRGVFVGDDVFAVTDNVVRGAPIDAIDPVAYELTID